MTIHRYLLIGLLAPSLVWACSGDDGQDGDAGENGKDAEGCDAQDNNDGTYTLTCGDTTITVKDGSDPGGTDAAPTA